MADARLLEVAKQIAEWAAQQPSVLKQVIFGSRASGEANEASDLDISVYVRPKPGDHSGGWCTFIEVADEWRHALGKISPWPVDLQSVDAGTYRMQRFVEAGWVIYQRDGYSDDLIRELGTPDPLE